MKNKNRIKRNLKYLINFIWYGVIIVFVAGLISIIIFNVSVSNIINFSFPVISFHMNRSYYQFNSHFLEVRRLDQISNLYLKRVLAVELNYPHNKVMREAAQEFYHVDFNELENFKKFLDSLRSSSKNLKSIPPISEVAIPLYYHSKIGLRYFKLNKIPQFTYGISILFIVTLFFIVMIIYNLKKGCDEYIVGSFLSFDIMKRLRYIGIYFFYIEFVRIFIFFWINSSIAHTAFFNNIPGTYSFHLGDINFAWIIAGACCLITSQILKVGAALKEEIELTV